MTHNIITAAFIIAFFVAAVNWLYWRWKTKTVNVHYDDLLQLYHNSLVQPWSTARTFGISRTSNYIAVTGQCKTPSGIDRTIEIKRFPYSSDSQDSIDFAALLADELLEKLQEI